MNTTAIIEKQASEILESLINYDKEAQGAYRPNSDTARLNDLKVYAEFCALNNLAGFPATGKQVAQFIDWMRTEKEWKLTTIRRRVSTLSTYHRAANLTDPSRDGRHVELALRKIAQTKPEQQKQAKPLQYKDLKKFIAQMEKNKEPEERTLIARDKALLMLAYDTMLRRSEIADVKEEDFGISESGFYLNAPFTKTNRGQRKDHRFVSAETMQAINSMMACVPKLKDGRIFRKIRYGRAGEAMTGQNVYHVIKTRCGDDFSGHSMRVGHAIDQRAAGLSLPEICQSGGWAGATMAMRYTSEIGVSESGAAKLAAKRHR